MNNVPFFIIPIGHESPENDAVILFSSHKKSTVPRVWHMCWYAMCLVLVMVSQLHVSVGAFYAHLTLHTQAKQLECHKQLKGCHL